MFKDVLIFLICAAVGYILYLKFFDRDIFK